LLCAHGLGGCTWVSAKALCKAGFAGEDPKNGEQRKSGWADLNRHPLAPQPTTSVYCLSSVSTFYHPERPPVNILIDPLRPLVTLYGVSPVSVVRTKGPLCARVSLTGRGNLVKPKHTTWPRAEWGTLPLPHFTPLPTDQLAPMAWCIALIGIGIPPHSASPLDAVECILPPKLRGDAKRTRLQASNGLIHSRSAGSGE